MKPMTVDLEVWLDLKNPVDLPDSHSPVISSLTQYTAWFKTGFFNEEQ